MNNKDATGALLMEHYQTYPKLQLGDVLKFLYQSAFGCEHLLSNPSAAIDYIRKEAANCHSHEGDLIEPLDGDYCRVHLDYLKTGLSAETLGRLFVLSARHEESGKEALEEKLAVLTELVKEGKLPFAEAETEAAIEKWRKDGYLACHHSEKFRSSYFPAYRLLRKEYALFLPLFAEIDRRLQREETVTFAVDGGSASGKSTLGRLLEQVYGGTVFHMDDFFLRPKQRTKERLSEAGGNVDRERFLEEVLLPLSEKRNVEYCSFDCSTFTLRPPVTVPPAKLNVIEGVYSMHPLLTEYYDFSVFLEITPMLQEERIRKRNSPEMAERFFSEWIPLENRYFESMQVKEHCNIVISIKE